MADFVTSYYSVADPDVLGQSRILNFLWDDPDPDRESSKFIKVTFLVYDSIVNTLKFIYVKISDNFLLQKVGKNFT
jgi:hypothetical protein